MHCFLSIFILLGAKTTHQIKGKTFTCLNLIFKMVDKECEAKVGLLDLRLTYQLVSGFLVSDAPGPSGLDAGSSLG